MRRTVRGASLLLAAGMLAVGLGACGDDDDGADAGGAEGGGAAGGDLSSEGAAGDAAAFCDAAVAVDAANLGLDSGETTPGDVDAALKAAEEAAPAQVSAAVGTMVTEAKAMMAESESAPEEGPPPIPSDAFFAASVDVGGYLADNCDFATLDVTATNYQFDGIADSVSAGTTVVNFDNAGTEFHEIALVRIDEGEERSLEELMALPEDEVDSLITEKGFVLAPPGAQTYFTADLDPGRYVAICFVPVGATPEALASGAVLNDEDGHFMHGMVAEFEVA
jgi:hypothetical protein